MIPAIPEGPSAVADEHGLGVEGPLDAVEGRHLLALGRGADDQLAARHLVEIERMQRLRGQQHHVVGDVDDVVDRSLPGRRQPRLQPDRRGANLDVGEDAGGEAWAELGDLDVDRGVVGRPRLARRLRVLGPGRSAPAPPPVIAWTSRATPWTPKQSTRFGVTSISSTGSPAAAPRTAACRRPALLEHHDPVGLLGELQLGGGEDHPFGGDSPQLRLAQLLAAGHPRSRQRRRRRSGRRRRWGRRRRSSARPRRCRPCRRRSRSASGCCSALSTLPTTKPSGLRRPDRVDPLDLGPGHHQALGQLRRVEARVAVLAQP